MTPDEILKGLYDETMVGNKPAVLELTQEGIDSGLPPERMLFEALIPSLEEVGARFERGDWAWTPHALFAMPFPRRGVKGRITGDGFDIHGDTADAGAGKHYGRVLQEGRERD